MRAERDSARLSDHTRYDKARQARLDYLDTVDDHCYIDSRQFKDYAARIEGVIHIEAAKERRQLERAGSPEPIVLRGITIRELHAKLGPHAFPEWTMDALEWLDSVEPSQVVVTRYRPSHRPTKYERKWKGKDGMRWLFGTTRYGKPPYADTGVENPASF